MILSICIPTYNRADVLLKSIRNILSCEDDRFEIIICDDSPNDITIKELSKIEDKRLIIIKNKSTLGFVNVSSCLTNANGLYSLLLLDKDTINIKYLPNLIDILENHDIAQGYIKLTCIHIGEIYMYNCGFDSVLHMAYLSKHCSGYFYKTKLYKCSNTVKTILKEHDCFPFPFELINSELAFLGASIQIELPILVLETPEDSARKPSGNFFNDKIYFMPTNRTLEFNRYCENLSSITNLSKYEKSVILRKIFYRYLFSMTTGLKYNLLNKHLCEHSLIQCHKLSLYELLNQAYDASKTYWSITHWIGIYQLPIYLRCIIRNIFSIIKSFL